MRPSPPCQHGGGGGAEGNRTLDLLVDRRGIEPRSPGCKPGVFPLVTISPMFFSVAIGAQQITTVQRSFDLGQIPGLLAAPVGRFYLWIRMMEVQRPCTLGITTPDTLASKIVYRRLLISAKAGDSHLGVAHLATSLGSPPAALVHELLGDSLPAGAKRAMFGGESQLLQPVPHVGL